MLQEPLLDPAPAATPPKGCHCCCLSPKATQLLLLLLLLLPWVYIGAAIGASFKLITFLASYSPPALTPTHRGPINQGMALSPRRRALTSRSAAHIACTGRRTEADTAARLLGTTTPQPVMRTSDEHFNPTPATVVGDTPSMAARANIV